MIINTNDQGVRPIELGGTGQSEVYKSITLSRWNLGTTGSETQSCRYYPYLGIVFFRGMIKIGVNTTAGAEFKLWSLTNAAYFPGNLHSMSCSSQNKNVHAYIKNDGVIYATSDVAMASGSIIYVSGFWLI